MFPLRLIPRVQPATLRVWLCLVTLAGVACLPTASAAATSEITLTIDCALCGPGQSFPHDCPRVNSSAAGLNNAEAFSQLVESARKETRRLRAINGLNLPDLGDVGSLAQLDAALTHLIAATEEEIARCDRERADFLRKSETADAENARLEQLAIQFSDEIAQSRAAIAAAESETAAEIRAASAARDEIIAGHKSINALRQAITQVRNRLFPRLHQAAHQGWILPPSSYQPMPAPLPPTTQLGGYAIRDVSPASSLSSTPSGSGEFYTMPVPLAAPALAPVRRSDVQAKLEQLPALWEHARTAAARRDEAIRSLEQHRSASDAQAARLAELQPQRAAAVNHLATATRNVTMARQAHHQHAIRAATTRAAAVHAWIEWGIFNWLDKKAAGLFARGERSVSTDAAFLAAWRETAAVAVQLGSDPLGVIARFPAAAAARGENLDDLQQDLAEAQQKFGVGFVTTRADVPATALPFLRKEVP